MAGSYQRSCSQDGNDCADKDTEPIRENNPTEPRQRAQSSSGFLPQLAQLGGATPWTPEDALGTQSANRENNLRQSAESADKKLPTSR